MSERTFTFSNGTEVRIKKLSQFVIMRLTVDNTDRYPIPEQLVKVGTRKVEKLIPNYDNPTYKALIEDQRNKDLSDTIASLASFGVIDDVPEDEYEIYEGMARATRGDDFDEAFVKSLWIFGQIESADELLAFQNAITGLTLPTEEGMAESEEKFQGDSE